MIIILNLLPAVSTYTVQYNTSVIQSLRKGLIIFLEKTLTATNVHNNKYFNKLQKIYQFLIEFLIWC